MHIIIKHIPMILLIDELESHLHSLLKAGMFKKQGQLKALKMLQLIDKNHRPAESHALVWTDSTASNQRLIKSINAGSFQDNFLSIDDEICNFDNITATEFSIRHFSNDRRLQPDRKEGHITKHFERRAKDRRRNMASFAIANINYAQPPSSTASQTASRTHLNARNSWIKGAKVQLFS